MEIEIDLEKLAAALPALTEAADAQRRAAWAEGAAQADVPLDQCPLVVGSWAWLRWLEGATGTLAPTREVVDDGFNMTPREEVDGIRAWLVELGLPALQTAAAVEMAERGYTAEALARP